MEEQVYDSLKFLVTQFNGVLSTHSVEEAGYPFGSITPFVLDQKFNPIVLISEIAQHTKNIKSNNKISILMNEKTNISNNQSLARYSILANATIVTEEDHDFSYIREKYLRYFPAAINYFDTHNFNFYRFNFHRGRFIKGFGKIFWIDQYNFQNVFKADKEIGIISHMNEDHKDSLKNILKYYKKIAVDNIEELNMVGISQFGFDVLFNKIIYHFDFEEILDNESQAREEIVKMAKASKGTKE